jgi:hypothetical protein
MAFFFEANGMIHFFNQLTVLRVKNANFSHNFSEKIFKNQPWLPVVLELLSI